MSQRLLGYARRGGLEPKPVDLDQLIEDELELLRCVLGGAVEIETVRGADGRQVHLDERELQSALLNLAVNARDAMPNGGKLVIATGTVTVDAAGSIAPAGDYVTLSVADNGIGMAEDVVNPIFEPFFTTKRIGQGTGLGLSQVRGFIDQAKGHITVDSAPGKGTRISIYLPRLAA